MRLAKRYPISAPQQDSNAFPWELARTTHSWGAWLIFREIIATGTLKLKLAGMWVIVPTYLPPSILIARAEPLSLLARLERRAGAQLVAINVPISSGKVLVLLIKIKVLSVFGVLINALITPAPMHWSHWLHLKLARSIRTLALLMIVRQDAWITGFAAITPSKNNAR